MDRETFKYMADRVDKYKGLNSRKCSLENALKKIESLDDFQFYIGGTYFGLTSYMNTEQKTQFKAQLNASIQAIITEIEKEMGEI